MAVDHGGYWLLLALIQGAGGRMTEWTDRIHIGLELLKNEANFSILAAFGVMITGLALVVELVRAAMWPPLDPETGKELHPPAVWSLDMAVQVLTPWPPSLPLSLSLSLFFSLEATFIRFFLFVSY